MQNIYDQYHALGENGAISLMIKELEKLPN